MFLYEQYLTSYFSRKTTRSRSHFSAEQSVMHIKKGNLMPENITQQVYEAISFEEGSQPSYENLLKNFISEGLFINNKGEKPMIKPINDYVSFIKTNVEAGNIISIKEIELNRKVTLFGSVGNIVSQYKLEAQSGTGKQTRYGVNLFQIIKHDNEWKISSMCWDDNEDKSLLDIGIEQ